MQKRILITGAEGFTGRYLAAELSSAGYEVFGLVRQMPETKLSGFQAVHACDLADTAGLSRILSEVRPNMVAHLAAIAFVAHGDVEGIYRTNVIGTRNLLDALARTDCSIKSVLLASSANIYGNSVCGVLDESSPPAPANDYAVSKLAMEYVARIYMDRLPIVIARPFNYTGIGQAENFLLPKIVSHVRRQASVIELGNLDVARDFSDVRTVTAYYRRLLETPQVKGDIFNVCSGTAYTLNEVLDMARAIAGHDFDVRVNPAFVRQNEVKTLIGSRAKLEAVVGHVEDISLADTLRWMIEA